MDPRRASSAFPPAIRARLSTEDSASDATSDDSDDSSGVGVAKEDEESYESALDDAASLRRPSMPKARITGDDEDDLEDEMFDDEEEEEDERILNLAVDFSDGDNSTGGDYEDLGGGFVSGKEESLFSNGSYEEDDIISRNEAPLIASMEEFHHDALENEGGLEFNAVKLEMNGSGVVELEVEEDWDSAADLHDQIEAVNSGNVEQSNHLSAGGYEDFGDGFVSGKEESLFSNGSDEEDDIQCGLDFNDVKLEMNGSAVVELEIEETQDSISDLHDQIEAVSSGNVEQSNDLSAGGCENFGDGFVSGKEESVFSNGSDEENDIAGDESPLIPSMEELQHAALENEGGLDFNDDKLVMNGNAVVDLEVEEDRDSIADLHDQIEAVSSRNVEQSNHLTGGGYENFRDGFVSGKEERVFSNGSDEKDDIAGDESPLIPSLEELQDDALENEGGCDVKLEMNGSDVVELEVEEDLDSIASVHDQIEAVSSGAVDQSNDSALELKDLVVESGNVGTEMNNLSGDIEATQKSVMEAVTIEAVEAEFSQVEDDSSEFKGFETNNVFYFVRDQILDLIAPTYSKAFEPRTPEECADNIKAEKGNTSSLDSEEANHTAGEILERYYPTIEISAGFLDNFEVEEDESRAIVTQVSITENYNSCEYSESESRFDSFHVAHDEGSGEEDELVISEWPARDASLESSEIMKHILKEMEEGSSSSHSGLESSLNHSRALDAQIISGSDEEEETEVDGSSKELLDTSVLAALLNTPSIFSINHPAGFKSAPLFSMATHSSLPIKASSTNNEERTLHSKVDQLWQKYLHLVRRLANLAGDPSPDHFLSEEFEKSEDDFVFSCNILVLGKTGVGKSAAINSIFGEERASTDPFQPATASVREISGVVDGVYISLIDTPGLLTSLNDRGANRKILSSVKKYIRRSPPDVVLYVDRLDAYTRDFDDVPMLRMISSMLGSSILNNAIITLTHAASTFSDGPDGSRLCYEAVVARRSRDIQQSIQRAAGDIRLVNPVALVENHSSCSRNMDGEILLPNGLRWRPWLLLLCYSSKILTEVDSILESKSSSAQKLFPSHGRSILSSLLKYKVHFKPFRNQGEDDYDSDIGLDSMTNEVPEEDDDYEVQKLINEQKSSYLLRKLKNLDRGKGGSDENATIVEGFEHEVNPSAVPIPLYDTLSPRSFHNENPPYLCRFLERKSQVLTRPDVYIRYRDCDSDYDGVIIEESFDVFRPFLYKNEFIISPVSSIASKHGENGSTLSNFSFQQVRKQMVYNPQGETKFMGSKRNKTAAEILVTFLGDTWVNGFKLEDQIFHGNKLPLVASIGIVRAERDVVYGANLELRLTEKRSSIKKLSTFGLSALKWRDFAVGAYLQSEFSTGQKSRISVRVGLTDPNTGRISIKTSTTKQVHVTLLGLFTIVLSICRSIWSGETD